MSDENLLWGKTTWQLIHTILERVKDDFFLKNKEEVFKIISNICENLPCPECSQHAKMNLKTINIKGIKKKEELIISFYNFHNRVNKDLNKNEYLEENLKLYKNYDLGKVINNFSYFYGKRYGTVGTMGLDSNEMSRKRILKETMNWLKKNWKYFN